MKVKNLLLFSLIISGNYIYSAEAGNDAAVPVATEADNQNLIHAASWGDIDQVSRLLRLEGININAVDQYSFTALMWASNYGHLEIVQLLIKHNVNVNALNQDDISRALALHILRHTPNKNIIELLLQNNADFGVIPKLISWAINRRQPYNPDVYNLITYPDEYKQYAKNPNDHLFVDALVATTPLTEDLADMVMDRTSIPFDLYLKAKKEKNEKRYQKIKNNLLVSLLAVGSYLAVNI